MARDAFLMSAKCKIDEDLLKGFSKVSPMAVKATLSYFCYCADYKTMESFPTIETLANFVQCDQRTIASAIKALIFLGHIKDTGKKAGKLNRIKVYKINLSTLDNLAIEQKNEVLCEV
jgi:hypothetical protein